MNFANFASFAISISVKFANFANGWCESDGILWCMLLLISSFPQITLIARIFSLRDVYGLQSTVTIRIYFSRSFFLPQMTQISLIFYHPDFTIFALLLRKKRSMDDTDFLLAAVVLTLTYAIHRQKAMLYSALVIHLHYDTLQPPMVLSYLAK